MIYFYVCLFKSDASTLRGEIILWMLYSLVPVPMSAKKKGFPKVC